MNTKIFYSIIKPLVFCNFLLFACAFQSDSPCDAKALKEKAQKQLEPYTYDMAKLTRIAYKAKPWLKEIEVPLFIGEKYRLVFNAEALPKAIDITIYNHDKDSKKRKVLFSSKDAANKKMFSFDVSFMRKVFVDYEIPTGDSTAAGGCLVFMLGYK
ncbi:MAG: hypothetical protein JST67_10295 [Bacteroidetes bacterium]|nr:hypothetical protein [Bacteroidota bacterium]